jgi:ABC-2 type transport system permease protein
MAALYGSIAAAFGLCVVMAGGARTLARSIVEGRLDAVLVQPKDALLHVTASQMRPSGFGDVVSGLGLVAFSGYLQPSSIANTLVAIVLGAIVLSATAILLQSLAFWFGHVEGLARQVWEFVIAFSSYPETISVGLLKVVLFTVVPAGFAAYLPVGLIREFSWTGLAMAAGGAALYATLAFVVFRLGLRRYESGNRFGALT